MFNITDPNTVYNILTYSGIISSFVLGLTHIAKTSGISSRWLPIVATVLGLILSFVVIGATNYVLATLVGLQSAFSAMGIHSGLSSVVKKDEELG